MFFIFLSKLLFDYMLIFSKNYYLVYNYFSNKFASNLSLRSSDANSPSRSSHASTIPIKSKTLSVKTYSLMGHSVKKNYIFKLSKLKTTVFWCTPKVKSLPKMYKSKAVLWLLWFKMVFKVSYSVKLLFNQNLHWLSLTTFCETL